MKKEDSHNHSRTFGLAEKDWSAIKSVFAKYLEIEEARLFGSRAMGTYRNGSDIDIALKTRSDVSLKYQHKIALDLDDVNLANKMDLIYIDSISNQDLLDHIERVGVVIYQRT